MEVVEDAVKKRKYLRRAKEYLKNNSVVQQTRGAFDQPRKTQP